MKLKTLAVLFGSIALVTVPNQVGAEELSCPAEFDGVELSDSQQIELKALEDELDSKIEAIMPTTPESEAQIEQLEDTFDQRVSALLSSEQEQQVEQLDAWAESNIARIAPELLAEDAEPELTEEQEVALESLEEAYDANLQGILTPEQQQQVELLEEQLDAEMEDSMPAPTPEQAANMEAAEMEFEEDVIALLTEDQIQQIQSNLEACSVPGEL
ncbi:MAG: hypothetical protein AAGA83_06970 [Cyanobacteria bacterium P01_F01_bin.116]